MSRLQTVRENWTEITTKLLRDKQELAHFLRFSAKMYKQSFSDAVLIYQQNPSATKVATNRAMERIKQDEIEFENCNLVVDYVITNNDNIETAYDELKNYIQAITKRQDNGNENN